MSSSKLKTLFKKTTSASTSLYSGCLLHVSSLVTLLTHTLLQPSVSLGQAGWGGTAPCVFRPVSEALCACTACCRPRASLLSHPPVLSASPYCHSQEDVRVFHSEVAEAGLAALPGSTPSVQASRCFEEQTGKEAGIGAGSASFKQQLGLWHSAAAASTLAQTGQTRAKWAPNPIISFWKWRVGEIYEGRIFRKKTESTSQSSLSIKSSSHFGYLYKRFGLHASCKTQDVSPTLSTLLWALEILTSSCSTGTA